MKAKSIQGNSAEAIQSALRQAMAEEFIPTLAVVFISVKQDRKAVCQVLQNKNIDIIGATSAGEFINGHHSRGEIAILLLDITKSDYCILFEETKGKDIARAAGIAAGAALSRFNNPAVILCSSCISGEGKMYDGTALVQTLQDALGKDAEIFGGMAGDDATLTATYIFTAEQSTDEGFAMLVLDNNKIAVYGMAISGWKPLGKVRTVTKSEDGWIYTLDGQPALDMYLRYLGQSLEQKDDGQKAFFIEDIGFFHPFLAIDAGAPVLRTPMEVDKERNAIKLDFAVPEGGQIQFTMPPDFDIVETVLDNAMALKENTHAEADALLIFSCLGRLSALGPMIDQENDGLHEIWKVPMAGFFSYGEYGKGLNSTDRFHSTTCSWVALKEK